MARRKAYKHLDTTWSKFVAAEVTRLRKIEKAKKTKCSAKTAA